ncbi:EthD domain-containing protein [Arthrobacter sp. cf158]|nr:EthD domain-containing protein [Arthrobacter sp. cf158]
MINFWLASRPKPGADRDMFDFEWGVIHVALMLTTPSVMAGFTKYSQHRAVDDVPDSCFPYGRHEKGWYSIANHVMPDVHALEAIFGGEDYPRRMQPHSFGDKEFVIELTSVVSDQSFGPGMKPGHGVKVVNFVAPAEGIDRDTFERVGRGEYSARIAELAGEGEDLRRYVQNTQLPLDAAMFKGTLFEAGGVQTYSGIEELWFPDREAARRFRERRESDQKCRELESSIIDAGRSFSMTVVERVVWDYTDPDALPRPAVETPGSVEAGTLATERNWGQWNTEISAQDGVLA